MVLAAFLTLSSCAGDDEDGPGNGPGDPEVYARIASLTDCAQLQEEFDIAMDSAESRQPGDPLRDVSIGYAEAAGDRLRDVGCYE